MERALQAICEVRFDSVVHPYAYNVQVRDHVGAEADEPDVWTRANGEASMSNLKANFGLDWNRNCTRQSFKSPQSHDRRQEYDACVRVLRLPAPIA